MFIHDNILNSFRREGNQADRIMQKLSCKVIIKNKDDSISVRGWTKFSHLVSFIFLFVTKEMKILIAQQWRTLKGVTFLRTPRIASV